jgi:hypothetical protein
MRKVRIVIPTLHLFFIVYHDFPDRGLLLTQKLLNQGFIVVKLQSPLRKCNGRHRDFVDRYGGSQKITDMSGL